MTDALPLILGLGFFTITLATTLSVAAQWPQGPEAHALDESAATRLLRALEALGPGWVGDARGASYGDLRGYLHVPDGVDFNITLRGLHGAASGAPAGKGGADPADAGGLVCAVPGPASGACQPQAGPNATRGWLWVGPPVGAPNGVASAIGTDHEGQEWRVRLAAWGYPTVPEHVPPAKNIRNPPHTPTPSVPGVPTASVTPTLAPAAPTPTGPVPPVPVSASPPVPSGTIGVLGKI